MAGSSKKVVVHIVAQEEHPAFPSPLGLSPYHLRVVSVYDEEEAHTGFFAPQDWLVDEAPANRRRFLDWLARGLLQDTDGECAALCLDAWAEDQPVTVAYALGDRMIHRTWEPESEALVDRSARAAAEGEAQASALILDAALPESDSSRRPRSSRI